MLDLGASVNVMAASIYEYLNLGPLKETGITLQLADRYNVYPRGIIEDVLVQVNQLIFPADFCVLEMTDGSTDTSLSLLLSRPFMSTARTKIDVHDGSLTMEFDGEVICFNNYETMRYPSDVHSCFSVDVINSLAQQMFDLRCDDPFETIITRSVGSKDFKDPRTELKLGDEFEETIGELNSLQQCPPIHDISFISLSCTDEKLLSSILQAPKLELKPLPDHLKYMYLGNNEEFPVIVSNALTELQEQILLRVLRE
ncbi:uncharacterized protein LOC113279439 [Papaver somniferum]|uniref:uncharacterized protein LOC113279439 n=1 Tax=Papaver somniferum TaxID=3469 RepID=UPI000E6FE0E6|nr:uncharacterized protein LOC113279439 [Papaver somniferum]